MYKKALIVTALFIVDMCFLKAQNIEMSVHASINYPVIPTVTASQKTYPPDPTSKYYVISFGGVGRLREKFYENPGGKIDLNIEYSFNKRLFLKTGIGLNLVSFKRVIQVVDQTKVTNDGDGFWTLEIQNHYSQSPNLGETFITYTEVPVILGYKFYHNKLSIGLGFTLSLVTFSVQYKDAYTNSYYGYSYPKEIIDKTGDGLTKGSISLDAEFAWKIKQKYSIIAGYSKQLSPIFDKIYQFGGKAKYNLFQIGFGYRFF